MAVPIRQAMKIGFYIMKQKMLGRKRYPLVLMLEPLYRCNLECTGCGKIQKPNEILKKYLSVDDCLTAASQCGAPVMPSCCRNASKNTPQEASVQAAKKT